MRAAVSELPLYFIENRGQVDASVSYYLQSSGTNVYFGADRVTFALGNHEPGSETAAQRWAVELGFVDADTSRGPIGLEPTPAIASYFKGKQSDWKTGLRTYGVLAYRDLWPGIDLIYTGTANRLKYTFVVQPGADPEHIELAYRGATDVRLTESGRLAVTTPLGGFEEDAPYVYQEVDGELVEIESAYSPRGSEDSEDDHFGFSIGSYDRDKPLIVDPVVLAYCGFIGGTADDSGVSIAVDSAGYAYILGTTWSSEASFPVNVGPGTTYTAGIDVFVAKVNPSGTALVYSGYIGGSGNEVGNAIAVDAAGNAYVTGYTASDELSFPVNVGPDLTYNGGTWDAYVAKVNATGTGLTYSGYVGGAGAEIGQGIAVDGAGNAYITGDTGSDEVTFPVTGGPDLVYNGGTSDIFVAKVNASGAGLDYCGYIGGAASEGGSDIAIDGANNAYITGYTSSDETTFPVLAGPDLVYNGGSRDAFVTKVNASGTALTYSGYLGGSGDDWARGIAVDGANNAYVTGRTDSTEASFPVTVGPDLTYNGGLHDAFVARVDAGGGALGYCGYIGGAGDDYAQAVALDYSGNAYVAGNTQSDETTFPVSVGPDLTQNGSDDAYVAKVKASGTGLDYAGYIGGANGDFANDVALDPSGNVYIVGNTQSDEASFPVTTGPDSTFNGGQDAFVAKLAGGALELIGFETGDASEIDTLGGTSLIDLLTVRPGSGIFALRQVGTSVLTTGLSLDTLGLRFSFLKPSNPGVDQPMVHFKAGAANLWTLRLTTAGALDVQHNESALSGTWKNTTLTDNTWYTVRVVYDRQANGILQVWLDAELEIDATHVTQGTATDNIELLGPAAAYHYDDIYLIDYLSLPPLGQVVRIGPNGPGVLTEFDTAAGVATHWQNVDEVTPSDADYNRHANTTVATDLYALEDSPSGTINAVKGMWRVQRGTGSSGRHDYAWRIDGINGSAELTGLGTAWELREVVWESPPTGVAWTEALVTGMEIGASHNGTQGQDTDISWTAAMVDYRYVGTPLYRSVGVSAADLNTSSRTVEITGTTATFSGPMPDNVGVGDVLQYQVAATFYVAFIHGRTSDTVYTVASSTGGTPQAAAAGTAVNVYRAYTSLANWESQTENTSLDNSVENFDTSTNLVSGSKVMNVACYGDGVDTTIVIIDGWTTGPDNYIKIYTPVSSKEVGASQRHSGVWDPSKYRIETGVAPIRVGNSSSGAGHVWIDGLQVFLTSVTGNGNSGILVNQTTQANHRISNNIVRGVTNSSFWNVGIYTYAGGANSTIRIWNNIVYDFDGTNSGVCVDFGSDADITAYAYNNTANNCFYGYRETGSKVILKNNISYGNSDNYAGTFDASGTNNLSGPGTDASMPATNARDGVTVTYVNAAGDDYHLAPGDTGAQDFGADLTSDANLGFFYDIDLGGRQTPWDIGADDVLATTAVELVSFVASGLDGAVELRWATGSELDNLGFNLYRAEVEEGPYERITSSPIPGLGSSPEGASYRYRDSGLTNGVTYFYELEDIETSGKTELHGPVTATPQPGVDAGSEVPSALVTFGDPSMSSLRVLERGRGGVVLELTTAGFYAEPQEDGTVVLTIPDFAELSSPGSPSIPVRRTWVEAIAGRKVELVSVVTREVEAFGGLRPSGAPVTELVAGRDGTVRIRQRVRATRQQRATFPKGRLYPSEAARLVSVGFQGDVKKALVELAPLRWDDATARLLLARRLEVTLSFEDQEPAERLTDGVQGRRYRRRRSQDTRHVLVRLATTEPGLYGIPFEEVLRGPGVDASKLRLSRQGEAVAFHVEPSSRRFGPGSVLFFVSQGASANPYGREAVYELEGGQPAERMVELDATPSGEASSFYWKTLEREENHYYQAALVDAPDVWLWDLLFAPVVKRYPFEVSALASATESSRLNVWLQGVSDAPAEPDHHVRVSVNGSFLEDVVWDGKAAQRVNVEIPPGILRDGENALELENVGDTEASYSMVMLDRFEVSYPRLTVADEGELEGRFSISGMAEIDGLRGRAHVLDVTDERPQWLTSSELGADGALRFRAESERAYLAVSPEAVLNPEVHEVRASALKGGDQRADYLVLGPRALLDAAQPLLQLRQRQGLEVRAIAIEDVFADFGFGETTPVAVRDFLAYAYHTWDGPPRYVVLLGDATYDYKDYLKTGVSNQVPPLMVKTSYLWTTSDPAYAAVNGDDPLPDLAIGRLPAATVDEARTMVAKIVAYETGHVNLDGRIVLVADNPDHAGDFQGDAEALASGILAGRDLRKIYLSELGSETARARIVNAFDEGASILSYLGHGGIHLWASEDLLNVSQVSSLSSQSQQPLVLTMNCLNGYYHFPYFNSLSEELVKAKDRGAIAAFSPSGLSLNEAARLYQEALLKELLNGGHERLGDAVLAAQEAYASGGAFPELLSIYHLLGDPALRLQ